MRDPKEMAAKMCADLLSCCPTEADCETIADALREAQEDGAREWKLTAQSMTKEHFESERQVRILEAQVAEWKNQCIVEAQAVAALTERAERAEQERTELLHRSRKTLAALHRNVMARRNAPGGCCDWSCDLCAPLMKLAEDDAC